MRERPCSRQVAKASTRLGKCAADAASVNAISSGRIIRCPPESRPRQARLGVVPPDFIIDDSIAQMQALIADDPAKNVLVANLASKTAKLSDLDANERVALIADATRAVNERVTPAYRRLIARMQAIRPGVQAA